MNRGIAILLLVVATTNAHAVQLCRNGKGVVAVRETCRAKERTLALEELGVTGIPGPAGEPGAPGARGPVLVDAAGTDVGGVASLSATGSSNQVCFEAVFVHPTLPRPVLLQVTGDGQIGGVVSYASADCTGTPHVARRDLVMPIAVGVGENVYVTDLDAATTLVEGSYEYTERPIHNCSQITARGGCCIPAAGSPSSVPAYPAIVTMHAALGLRPPFAITLR